MLKYAQQILSIESVMGKRTSLKQDKLRIQLASVLDRLNSSVAKIKFDFIITHCEINQNHGVGVLLKAIFSDSQGILTIRSINSQFGKQNFGSLDLCISHQGLPRSGVWANVMLALDNRVPDRILSVPYYLDDVLSTIAIKDRFGAPLCTYLMDDQNVYINNIPDRDMRELLQKSDLRFGISRELCQAYEDKYNLKFWYLPPTVEERLILKESIAKKDNKKGILLGNIWSQNWLLDLRKTLRDSGIEIDWYGNEQRDWLSYNKEELAQDGIVDRGYCPEAELIEKLRNAAYAVVPTGISETENDRPELAKLSLPSRITYITATANIPIIVLGSKRTAAAKFVEAHKIGIVCDYDRASFQAAVAHITQPKVRQEMSYFAGKLGQLLSASGVKDWIWESLRCGRPADLRYENLGKRVNAADVIITLDEKTQKHGTGALVRRIFAHNTNNISIRSTNQYGAEQDFGNLDILLKNEGLSRQRVFEEVLKVLGNSSVKRVYCTPYWPQELMAAIAVKDLFGAPMATYIMDDQNYCINKIPDDLMREFLSKCSLRLATHPELRDAYEEKYGLKFWLLPAIVPDRLIHSNPSPPDGELLTAKTGALMGSIWSPLWFEMLSGAIADGGVTIDWYGNRDYPWLEATNEELAAKGLRSRGLLAETELVAKLLKYPYVIVPVGTLDEKDDRQELRLSLPGRIIFILASTNTPIILMGSKETSGANFLDRFGIGVTCDYDGASLARAVDYVTNPEIQARMRQNAASIAAKFSDRGIEEWLWQSLELGEPVDKKFEELMSRSESDLAVFIEPPVPQTVSKHFTKLYQVMRRLVNRGLNPDFIIDVGCSYGIWSSSISKLFPEARFIAIDPLLNQYPYEIRNHHLSLIPNLEILLLAIGDRVGKTSFQVSKDLYGSSLLHPADFRSYKTVQVEVNTLDNISKEKNITGRGILKLDVQCGEHLVLEGAKDFLQQVDILVAELSLFRYDRTALTWMETIAAIEALGFRYYDETDEWRSPVDGTLLQKEAVFVREDLFLPEIPQVKPINNDIPKAVKLAKEVDGFMTEAELIWLYENASGECVEIGSRKGKSSTAIALKLKKTGNKLTCIDLWTKDEFYKEFLELVETMNLPIVAIKSNSLEAVKQFKDFSLDWIFIDSSHEYEETVAEIKAWLPKLKPGGMLCGHDFLHPKYPGLTRAVRELCPNFVNPVDSIWATIAPYNSLK